MQIDKSKDYKILSYTFRNFINLTFREKRMVLHERNHPDVKKWMFTNEDIREKDHLRFIDSLVDRNDAFYWLVERDDVPVGVLSIVHCNYEKN